MLVLSVLFGIISCWIVLPSPTNTIYLQVQQLFCFILYLYYLHTFFPKTENERNFSCLISPHITILHISKKRYNPTLTIMPHIGTHIPLKIYWKLLKNYSNMLTSNLINHTGHRLWYRNFSTLPLAEIKPFRNTHRVRHFPRNVITG
jgi:hypothetical protein